MALLTHTGHGSGDIASGTQVFDFSPLILASLRQEEAVIAHLNVGPAVKDTTWYIQEDALLSNQVQQNGTLATTATTLNVDAGHGARLRVGAVLQVINDGTNPVDNGEQVQVTAISTDALTITRSYGLTDDPGTTYADNCIWKVISQTLPENSDLQADLTQDRTLTNFVTQIFERSINISRNQIKRAMQGVTDEFTYQMDQRAVELRREMNDTFIFGSQNPEYASSFPATTVGDNRTTAGLIYALTKAGSPGASKTYNNTAEALTPAVLNDLQYQAHKRGGNPMTMFMGGRQARVVNAFGADLVRTVPNERVKQQFTTLYRTDLGVILTMVVDGNWDDGAAGTVAIVDTDRVMIRPFVDAEMFVLTAPSFRDGDAARVISEWGLEVRNAVRTLDAHAIHTKLTIPA